MKHLSQGLIFAAVLSLFIPFQVNAVDIPGFAVGLFYESRVENNVYDEDISFDYYGFRAKFRDERYVEVFADIGQQKLDVEGLNIDDSLAYGLGLTLWILRDEDLSVPLDVGILGSYHIAEHSVDFPVSGYNFDIKHTRLIVQGVIRADYGMFRPFIYAGILNTKLDADDNLSVSGDDDLEKTQPAVNVGVDFELSDRANLKLFVNYYESIGGGINLDFWF